MSSLRFFTFPLIFTIVGVVGAGCLGYADGRTIAAALSGAFVCAVLGLLEVSLSFDNAIVNARILQTMDPIWRRRFLTWGIIIAVFGMRVVFPLAIVAFAAGIGPLEAVRLAIRDPETYARALSGAHVSVSSFGGSFLSMVALRYFFDEHKTVHWIASLERRLAGLGSIEGVEIASVLLLTLGVSYALPGAEAPTFLRGAIYGLVTFVAVEGIGHLMNAGRESMNAVRRTGATTFLYLEVLDASFSFDAVIGAFALSKSIFIIAIGLGIGASFVRALTVLMVEEGTLARYRFLEHGAFYAILSLALIMFVQTFTWVPDLITGVIGAAFVALAIVSSILWSRRHPGAAT